MRYFLFLVLFLSSVVGAFAAELGVNVRLASQKTGSDPLPILVTVRSDTVATENNLSIILDSGWVVTGSAIVSTAGLPSGTTPLPSILNGVINGQEINFVIGDLATGVDYGFYITNGIGINPGVGTKTWTVSTGSDSKKIGMTVLSNDQLVVTGRVGAMASDFQINITADKSGELSNDEIITYEIDYGTYLLGAVNPLVISGNWSRGTVAGSPSPSVDIVDYVIGSGTTGYGGVAPVIDLLNRKIVWTINTFPANTINQKVRFQLQINNSYSGSSNVDFDVSALLNGANVVTVDSAINQIFRPTLPPSPTPTIVSNTPTQTPDSTPTPTITSGSSNSVILLTTPTPVIIGLKINQIEIISITDDSAIIGVSVNNAASKLMISFGENVNKMSKSLTSVNGLKNERFTLESLKPETDYYFKVQGISSHGETVDSEVYTFRTARQSQAPVIEKNTVILSVANNIILNSDSDINNLNSVVLLPNTNYAIRLKLSRPELIKRARILIRNTQVLGINTVYGAEPNAVSVDLMEIEKDGLFGHLVSPRQPGYFEILIRLEDDNGNIVEEIIGQLRIVDPLIVVDSKGNPIENAKVTTSRFNKTKKIYEIISDNFLGMKNPNYTDQNGRLMVNFLAGKYEVEVSEYGYQTKVFRFDVGWGDAAVLPVITLDNAKFNFAEFGGYYWSVLSNVQSFTGKYADNLFTSGRFYSLISGVTIFLFVIVLNSFVTKELGLRWWMLPFWFVRKLRRKDKSTVYGKVIDRDTKNPIPNAVVYVMDGIKNKIIKKVSTNLIGEFEFMLNKLKIYKLIIKKKGYETTNILDYSYEGLTSDIVVIEMENEVGRVEAIQINLVGWVNKMFYFVITFLLFFVLLIELGFISIFGVIKVGPWLLLDCLLLWCWITINYGKN